MSFCSYWGDITYNKYCGVVGSCYNTISIDSFPGGNGKSTEPVMMERYISCTSVNLGFGETGGRTDVLGPDEELTFFFFF